MSISTSSSTTSETLTVLEHQDDDDWLDKQCLKRIRSVSGCSRLCNACLLVLRGARVRHLRYHASLSISAKRGCHLCIYLLDWLSEYVDEQRSLEKVDIECFVFEKDSLIPKLDFSSYRAPGYHMRFFYANAACQSYFFCSPVESESRLIQS